MATALGCALTLACVSFALISAAPPSNDISPDVICLPSYELMPGAGCYKGHKLLVTWDTAERFCQTEGAHLAVPESQLETDALLQLSKALEGVSWVGLKDIGDRWVTVEAKEYGANGYTAWGSGRPSTLGRCAILASWGVGDYPCDNTYAFICQQSKGL